MELDIIVAIIGAAGAIIAAVIPVVWNRRSSGRSERDRSESGYIMHTVQPEETLWVIAEQHYNGDGSRYRAIRKANPQITSDNQTLYPGQKLRIPKDSDNAMPGG